MGRGEGVLVIDGAAACQFALPSLAAEPYAMPVWTNRPGRSTPSPVGASPVGASPAQATGGASSSRNASFGRKTVALSYVRAGRRRGPGRTQGMRRGGGRCGSGVVCVCASDWNFVSAAGVARVGVTRNIETTTPGRASWLDGSSFVFPFRCRGSVVGVPGRKNHQTHHGPVGMA